jgi:GTPase
VMTMTTIDISPANLSLLPWLYANAMVDERHDQEDGSVSLDIRISEAGAAELERKLGTVKSKKDEW